MSTWNKRNEGGKKLHNHQLESPRKQISVHYYTGETALRGLRSSSMLFKNQTVDI